MTNVLETVMQPYCLEISSQIYKSLHLAKTKLITLLLYIEHFEQSISHLTLILGLQKLKRFEQTHAIIASTFSSQDKIWWMKHWKCRMIRTQAKPKKTRNVSFYAYASTLSHVAHKLMLELLGTQPFNDKFQTQSVVPCC